MTDVLDQSEVDALLAAVDTGDVKPDAPAASPGRSRAAADVQTYDFKRPERVSKDQMRALEALHEGFGRNFGAAISGYLRTIIEVNVAHIEQLTYSEFIHSLPNPTCFNLLKAEQRNGERSSQGSGPECLPAGSEPFDHLPGDVRTEHIERAMREIQHAEHAEHE